MDELKPLTAPEALCELADYFLGDDWYVADPLGVTQVNAIIVDEIKKKYPNRKRSRRAKNG